MKRRIFLLLIIVLLLAGCTTYERVMVPPRVDIGGSKRIAVLFFGNLTDDYALSYEVEQRLCAELSGYYQVVEPVEADWALEKIGLYPAQTPSPKDAQRLGELLQVDALVFGEVSGYFEPIVQSAPYIIDTRQNEDGELENKWEISQLTQVMISFTGRVMDTHSGNIIFRQRVQGEDSIERKKELIKDWLPKKQTPPPAYLIPRITRADIPAARRSALKEAVEQFTADLMPTYVWRKAQE